MFAIVCCNMCFKVWLRDYITEIEAAVTAKLSTWKPEHLSLWVDLVQPPAGPAAVATEVELVEMEDQAQAARYRERCGCHDRVQCSTG